MVIFKLLIREFREKRKLTEKQLADKVGISQGYLNKIEQGLKTPSLKVIEKLGNALKVDPAKLVIYDITYRQNRKSKSKSTLS